MSNIFFTSDTHYGHSNIASKSSSNWFAGWRDFNSLQDMNQELIKNINKTVGVDDTLWHLGDWSFGGIDNIWKFRSQINCQNIHIVLGNHDHHIEENKILPNVHYQVGQLYNNGKYILLDGPCVSRSTPNHLEVEAKEIFSSVQHYKELILGKRIFILSHYAHAVWHGSHKGWLHLFGHSHDSYNPQGKSMDVGVDSAYRILGEYRPFSLKEVVDILDQKDIKFSDHHDSSTNTGKPQGAKRR